MTSKAERLRQTLQRILGDAAEISLALREVTLVVKSEDYLRVMQILRDNDELRFDQMMDLCGVDYSEYGEKTWMGSPFAVVVHLLSLKHNWRVRVRVFAPEGDMPVLPTITGLWQNANWYEREAFDLFGILFDGHPDLRRILTDYGFVGHPFRKDFPVSGYVEMRYDEQEKRIVYQPVTIDPREQTRRVIREDDFGRR